MRRRAAITLLLLVTVTVTGCGATGDGGTGPSPNGPDATLTLTVRGLLPLDPLTQGRYEVWALDGTGRATSLGAIAPASPQPIESSLPLPPATTTTLAISLEPSGDIDAAPSSYVVLRGAWRGGRATLGVEGALTTGDLPLKQQPGQFTMFSPSDNYLNGYPSFEESGVWLFNIAPRQTPQNDMWVRLAGLQPGWTYEGWMVRDHGAADALWLSYGKFRPDATGALSTRDDTGWGPFSGVLDYRTAGEEEFPGDDWISNPLGYPLPPGLTLPLDLRERNSQGIGRWTHVITIEPVLDLGEAIGAERPFGTRPYRDPFGDGAPGLARTITYRAEGVPSAEAQRR